MLTTATFIVLACVGNAANAGNIRAPSAEGGLVKPLSLDQRLVICNAYPNSSPIVAKIDGQEPFADSPVGFRECRYVGGAGTVKAGDRLSLTLRDAELHGTFEVGSLPPTDAELLLVPYKRKGSPMIHFQSFAFPTRADGKDAQLALLDAYGGSASGAARMRMADAVEHGKPKGRAEELAFDRVYQVDAGVYETSVDGTTPKLVNLLKDQNYVFIRAGDDESSDSEGLMVFPESPLPPPPPPAKPIVKPEEPGFLSRLLTKLFGFSHA